MMSGDDESVLNLDSLILTSDFLSLNILQSITQNSQLKQGVLINQPVS